MRTRNVCNAPMWHVMLFMIHKRCTCRIHVLCEVRCRGSQRVCPIGRKHVRWCARANPSHACHASSSSSCEMLFTFMTEVLCNAFCLSELRRSVSCRVWRGNVGGSVAAAPDAASHCVCHLLIASATLMESMCDACEEALPHTHQIKLNASRANHYYALLISRVLRAVPC
jgi:hypothetical protein